MKVLKSDRNMISNVLPVLIMTAIQRSCVRTVTDTVLTGEHTCQTKIQDKPFNERHLQAVL